MDWLVTVDIQRDQKAIHSDTKIEMYREAKLKMYRDTKMKIMENEDG